MTFGRNKTCSSAEQAEQQKSAQSGEASLRTCGVAGPFALEPDSKPNERSYGEAECGSELSVAEVHHRG
jgi:hypothetical protein